MLSGDKIIFMYCFLSRFPGKVELLHLFREIKHAPQAVRFPAVSTPE